MEALLQTLVIGVQIGAIYALIAVGYTMVYGVLKMINFAHGEVYMLGAFFGFLTATSWFHLSASSSGLAIAAVFALATFFCAIAGGLIERFAYRPLRDAPRLTALITAIGVSFLLQNGGVLVFGAAPQYFPRVLPETPVKLGFLSLGVGQLWILGVSLILMVGLRFLVLNTAFGRAMRAISQDYQAASLMGIDVDRTILLTFMLGAAIAGFGGAMNAAFVGVNITPYSGLLPGLKAFVAAVLGGIGNIPGAVLGGILMGVAEALVTASKYNRYSDAIAFVILILVLLVRPSGLLGKASIEKV